MIAPGDLAFGLDRFGPNLGVGGRYALRLSFGLLEKIIAGRDLRVGVIVITGGKMHLSFLKTQ